jgi:hypothetical protein
MADSRSRLDDSELVAGIATTADLVDAVAEALRGANASLRESNASLEASVASLEASLGIRQPRPDLSLIEGGGDA